MASGPDETTTVSGTEFAAALMAGSVALFTEAHPGRSAMEVLNAAYLAASAEGPGSLGVPDMAAAVLFPDGLTASPLEEVDAGGRVTTLTPLFVWDAPSIHPLALPVRFTIEISEDPSFGTITLADLVNTALIGQASIVDSDTTDLIHMFTPAATHDLVTLDGTNTGGGLGCWIQYIDLATDVWSVQIVEAVGGTTPATPFSSSA